MPVAWFFHADAGRPEAELKMVVRREDRRQLRLPTVGTNADLVVMDLLTPDLSGDIQLLMMTLEPGSPPARRTSIAARRPASSSPAGCGCGMATRSSC